MGYWNDRNLSRLSASMSTPTALTIILDSMDQQKFAFPRHFCFLAKEWQKFIRPRLVVTTVIVHGWFTMLFISPPTLSSTSSRSVDIIANALHEVMARGGNLVSCHVTVQGDNCSKECKHNGLVRFAAELVSKHVVKSMSINTLQSGHSHEDVDGCHSQFAAVIEREKELLLIEDFARVLRNYLGTGIREHEPGVPVKLVDQVRDWNLGCIEQRST